MTGLRCFTGADGASGGPEEEEEEGVPQEKIPVVLEKVHRSWRTREDPGGVSSDHEELVGLGDSSQQDKCLATGSTVGRQDAATNITRKPSD